MQVEHINPFLKAIAHTFRTMLACDVERGSLRLVKEEPGLYDVSGVIGMSGNAAGSVVVSLSKEVALKAASTMLCTEITEIDDDVADAVGELANMVAGAAKAELQVANVSISLPNVIVGQGHAVHFPSNVQPICIPLSSPWGPMMLQVGIGVP